MFAKSVVALFLAMPLVAQSVLASSCSRKYVVKEGDICDSISAANNVSTYQLAAANQGTIDPTCDNLVPGETICLAKDSEDCSNTYIVCLGDTCDSIEAKFGINSTVLYGSNPQINQGCTNIYVGEVLCISGGASAPPPPAGVKVIPPSTAIPANPSATGVHPTSTSTTPTPSSKDGEDDNLPYCDEL
jgi:LysM repeat protein